MKTLQTDHITSTVSMPIKAGTIDFLQVAWKEIALKLATFAGSNVMEIASSGTAIWGLENTDSFPNYDIRPGLIYFGGELYICDGATFTASVGQTAICSIVTTYQTASDADPVLFTDGNSYNVHEIKKINVSAGTSGTGAFNYSTLTFINPAHNKRTQGSFHAQWSSSAFTTVRNPNGLITFAGKLKSGSSATTADLICTLPTGWRPATDLRICVGHVRSTSPYVTPAIMKITTSGQVFIESTYDGTVALDDNFHLDGISFYKSF